MSKRKNDIYKVKEYTKRLKLIGPTIIKPIEKVWETKIKKLEILISNAKQTINDILHLESYKHFSKRERFVRLTQLKKQIKMLKERITHYKKLLNKDKKRAKSSLYMESTKPGYKLRF